MPRLQCILDIPMGTVVDRVQKKRGRGRPPRMDIVSEKNNREHWTIKRKRRILHTNIIKKYWWWKKPKIELPCVILLTRVAVRKLDDDNLTMALSGIKDTVADLILPGLPRGRADGDPRLIWEYGQVRGAKGLRIEIYTKPKEEYGFHSLIKKTEAKNV